MQLSTEGLDTWSVEVTFSLQVAPHEESVGATSDDGDFDVVEHVAEFKVIVDDIPIGSIAGHIQDNAQVYFEALQTGIEYHALIGCQVTSLILSIDPTFLLISGNH